MRGGEVRIRSDCRGEMTLGEVVQLSGLTPETQIILALRRRRGSIATREILVQCARLGDNLSDLVLAK